MHTKRDTNCLSSITTPLPCCSTPAGTTGVSKGATLTHGNLIANVMQAYHWIAPGTETGGEKMITALPMYHIFALTANGLTHMHAGTENLLIPIHAISQASSKRFANIASPP